MIKNIFLFLFFAGISTVGIIAFYKISPANINTPLKPQNLSKTSFSIDNPPSDSLKGNITSISGSVSFQPRSSDYASTIKDPRLIVQGDEISTLGNGKASISFPNIGNISLSPDTHLNIVQSLSQNFVTQITQGEANFQRIGNIPLSVISLDLSITLDDGTDIDVIADKDNSEVLFTINKGEVTFTYTDTSDDTSVIKAKEGKQIIFDNNTKTFNVKYL
jgi:hypothetical protein